jgi:hypothetical protein
VTPVAEGAVTVGQALVHLPGRLARCSAVSVTGDLLTELRQRYTTEPGTTDYVERISVLATGGD